MSLVNEESYYELIGALQKFKKEAEEQCMVMQAAGMDCVENMYEDPSAVSANNKLQQCIGSIHSALEAIQGIISNMQEELEEVKAAAAKAKFD